MFNRYQNVPSSYDIYTYETLNIDWKKVKKPLEQYNALNELIGYTWYYGDEIVLEFETTGTVDYGSDVYDDSDLLNIYEDAADYLAGGVLKFELFDFRREPIFEQVLPGATTVKFLINEKTSTRLFKGIYRCKLTFIDKDHAVQTLINPEDYIFTIN